MQEREIEEDIHRRFPSLSNSMDINNSKHMAGSLNHSLTEQRPLRMKEVTLFEIEEVKNNKDAPLKVANNSKKQQQPSHSDNRII